MNPRQDRRGLAGRAGQEGFVLAARPYFSIATRDTGPMSPEGASLESFVK